MAAAQPVGNYGDEAWRDTYDEERIHQFQTKTTHKFNSSSRSTELKDTFPWNNHKYRPNQHDNSHKLYNETELDFGGVWNKKW